MTIKISDMKICPMNLKDYLSKIKERPTVWGKRHGISPSLMSRILAGKQGNLSLKNARKIVDSTGGAVDFHDLVPIPAQDNGAGEEEATKNITL